MTTIAGQALSYSTTEARSVPHRVESQSPPARPPSTHHRPLRPVIMRSGLAVLEGVPWTIFMLIVTIASLFIDDIQATFFNISSDDVFGYLSLFILIVFAIEWVALSVFNPRYLLSFFFFLDLVSTLAILPQIPWLANWVTGASVVGSMSNRLVLIRAARASRAGSRAGRLLKAGRILRILRVGKVYAFLAQRKPVQEVARRSGGWLNRFRSAKPSNAPEMSRPHSSRRMSTFPSLKVLEADAPQSKVGVKLSELTTQRLAVIVLVMLLAIPILRHHDDVVAPLVAMDDLMALSNNATATGETFALAFRAFLEFKDKHSVQEWNVLLLRISGSAHQQVFVSDQIVSFRISEVASYYVSDGNESIFSDLSRSRKNGWLSMILTVFVVVILSCGSMVFSRDTETLIIAPIERMIVLIDRLRKNPLARRPANAQGGKKDDVATMETGMLEHTLLKLTALLQIGFGEAGSAMIEKNINANGELNPMIDGRRILAIFGFVDIRGFATINERLEENIMLFVNEVAEIVHMEVHKAGGAVNRNLGEAFLLVWKIPQIVKTDVMENLLARQFQTKDDFTDLTGLSPKEIKAVMETQHLASQALSAFIRVICSCANPSSNLQELIKRSELSEVFLSGKVPIGCGLHIGWGIEGAIGSRFKIDASYLSPHVNTAARLMAATKQYNVPLLISGQFWSILPKTPRSRCRIVDRVSVKGSNVPMTIYTFDINTVMLVRNVKPKALALISMTKTAIERRRAEHQTKSMIRKANADFERDKLLSSLQVGIVKPFRENNEIGISEYLDGDWESALKHLQTTLRFKPSDGPTENVLEFIQANGGKAPEDWRGFRPLQSK